MLLNENNLCRNVQEVSFVTIIKALFWKKKLKSLELFQILFISLKIEKERLKIYSNLLTMQPKTCKDNANYLGAMKRGWGDEGRPCSFKNKKSHVETFDSFKHAECFKVLFVNRISEYGSWRHNFTIIE